MNKLAPYRSPPRSAESDFFRDVAGKAPLFGKDRWRKKLANAPLIYGAPVQADSALWLPGREVCLPAVFVFALDGAHMYDTEWPRWRSAPLAACADAWCVTYKFERQTILPGNRLPEDGIVPFLLEAPPKKQMPIQLASIPGKYYSA